VGWSGLKGVRSPWPCGNGDGSTLLSRLCISLLVILVGAAAMFDLRCSVFRDSCGGPSSPAPIALGTLEPPAGDPFRFSHVHGACHRDGRKSRLPPQIIADRRRRPECRGVSPRSLQSVRNWNQHVAIPATAKAAAVLSLVLWVGVIACGRMLAYL